MSLSLRQAALQVVSATELETKLRPIKDWTDDDPGKPLRLEAPGRPENLPIRPGRQVKVPPLEGMSDPHQRARILHALANHELQAAELFAWALLAFADAPREFRHGLAEILDDEQRHTRMYIARVESCGYAFGDFPVTGYFWHKLPGIQTPLHFVSAMSLTFENANLDHTVEIADAARRAGDVKTAQVIDAVGDDEKRHVRFGWQWLNHWKDEDADAWDAWNANLEWPLRPIRAKGKTFQRQARLEAGLDEAFVDRLAAAAE